MDYIIMAKSLHTPGPMAAYASAGPPVRTFLSAYTSAYTSVYAHSLAHAQYTDKP